LTVEDAGLGVPDGELDRIFDKFYRVQDPIERARPGTGIGLAVVRGLAEAMGAGVHARRSALGGLAVDITLPAAQLPPELTASADTVPGLGMPA
jgi:signal transduction histidine kinase